MSVIEVSMRLLLAVIISGFIGYERELNNRAAGFRTHILVCVGAAVTSLIQVYTFEQVQATILSDPRFQGAISADMLRLGAQVISGVGFLGVGTIIHEKGSVKGLTTAAALWTTACMGLAIGIGFYSTAIVGCILISFVTFALHRIDNIILSKSKIMDVYIEYENTSSIGIIIDKIKKNMIHVDAVEIVRPSYDNSTTMAAILTLRVKKREWRYDLVAKVCEIEGVTFAEEI